MKINFLVLIETSSNMHTDNDENHADCTFIVKYNTFQENVKKRIRKDDKTNRYHHPNTYMDRKPPVELKHG